MTDKAEKTDKTNETKKKRLPQSQRKYIRRLKQAARKSPVAPDKGK